MQGGKHVAGLVGPHLFSEIQKRLRELLGLARQTSDRRQQAHSHSVPLG